MKKRLSTALVVLTGLFLLSASIVCAEPPVSLAKTGQTTSYATGDDGDLQKGVASPSPRFTDNDDGTVTDNLTGLMWAKDANHGLKAWSDAISYANNLSLGTSCGSPRTDWRLPNRNELNSLIDVSNYGPVLPSGHPFSNVQSNAYWSSTTWPGNITYASYVSMQMSGWFNAGKSTRLFVWPVRGGSSVSLAKTGQTTSYATGDDGDLQKGVASPSPRFTDNDDGTVTDNLTGLMWAKDANPGPKAWSDAISYANNLSLGTGCGSPLTDWRIPNRNELNSLIDVSNYGPVLPSGHPFSNVWSNSYWSSTSWSGHTNKYAVTLTMLDSDWFHSDKSSRKLGVWPVRGGN